jgi:FKBP-type peptidyl-prolyl cis-trans isomerase FkpA
MPRNRSRLNLENLEARENPATAGDYAAVAGVMQGQAAVIQSVMRDFEWMAFPGARPIVQQFIRGIYQESAAAMQMSAAGDMAALAQSNLAFAQNVSSWLNIPLVEPPPPPSPDAGMTNTMPDLGSPSWIAQANGLKTWDVKIGTGDPLQVNDSATAFYTGWLTSGTVFDSARSPDSPFSFTLRSSTPTQSGVIEGWVQGLAGMQPGGIRRLYIPAALAYGSTGQGSVPPNADLIFEVKLMSHT